MKAAGLFKYGWPFSGHQALKMFSWEPYEIFPTFFYPAGNYMFKINNRNTRTRRKICSKLTIKAPERRQWAGKCRLGGEKLSGLGHYLWIGRFPGFKDSTSLGDSRYDTVTFGLEEEWQYPAINIGWWQLSHRQWPKVGRGTVKQQLKVKHQAFWLSFFEISWRL